MLTRETATFSDSDGWNWEFDLTFMLSNYQCIWGKGCPDTRKQGTVRGCCPDGVEIYQGHDKSNGEKIDDDEQRELDDLKKIRGRISQLTDEDWQNRRLMGVDGVAHPAGEPVPDSYWAKAKYKADSVHTRLHRGACIFHNRDDHPAGAGCAFHVAAMRRDEDYLDWKPNICWQVPLFFDSSDETRSTVVRANRASDWGDDVMDWWCMEHDEAFSAAEPVYLTLAHELRRVCGDAVYEEMADHMANRQALKPTRGRPVMLPMAPVASPGDAPVMPESSYPNGTI